jgi:hypothetical protein
MKNADIDALKKRVAKGELLTKAEQLQVLAVLRRANRRIKDALNDLKLSRNIDHPDARA